MNTRFVFTMILAVMLLSTQAIAISTSSLPMSFDYTQNGAAFTGTKSFTLRLYDVSSGGAAVWSDTQLITFADGKASIQLDNLQAVDWTQDVWFTAQPNGGNEMSPRLKLLMSPDALNNPFNYNRATGKVELRNTSMTTVLYTTNITGIVYAPQICLAGDCKVAWPTGGSNSTSNITSVAGLGPYLIGNASSGDVVIQINETKVNATIDARTLGQEGVEDFTGGMVSGNTESLISVTYDDGTGKLNFAVTGTLSSYTNDIGFINSSTYPNLDTDSTNDLTTAGGTINGNLSVLGRLTVIGDLLNATVTNQYLNGTFYPSIPLTFDIGSETQKWKDIFAGKFHANDWTNVTISKSQITEAVSVAGTCAAGYVVQNTTTSGVQCILMQTGTGDLTDVLAADTTIIVTNGAGPQPSVGVNTTYLDANYVGQNEYANLDTDSTNDLTLAQAISGVTSANGNFSGNASTWDSCGAGEYSRWEAGTFNCYTDAGLGGGMTGFVLSNGSTTESITDSEQVNITAGRNITITQVGSQLVINAIDTDTNTQYTNGTGLLLTGTQFNISTVYFDANYVGQSEYANLDTDSTNDLTTGTTFAGDVSGAYNAIQIGVDTIGDSELNLSQVTLLDFTNDAGFITTSTDQNNYTITCTISGTTTKTAQCSRNGAANYSYSWTDLDTDTNSGGISNVTQLITGSNYLIVNSNSTTFNITANLTALNAAYNDSSAIAAKASPGTCAAGQVVQNTTTGGVQCVAQTVDTNSGGTVTQVNSDATITGGGFTTSGTLGVNQTWANTQFYNKTYALPDSNISSASTWNAKAGTGTASCAAGTVAQNVTTSTGGVTSQCVTLPTDTNSGGVSNVTQLITGSNYLIVNSNSTTFNITQNTTALDANFVGQSEYANLDTDSTNDLTTSSVFNNASGDVNVSGHYNDLVLDVNCVAVTGSADLCDGNDAGGSSYTNGTGLSLVGTQFNHSDTSTQASSDNSGRTYIQDITLDGMGHITGLVTGTETFTDTNSGGTSNVSQFITGNNYLIVSSNSTTFNVTVNTTAFDANFVGQSEYANLDTDSTNDLITTSAFKNASGDVNVSGTYQALVLDVNCVAVTGSADLCDGNDAGGTSYTNGTGISLVGTQFNHSDTSTQASSDNSGRTYIQDLTLDGFGHITGLVTGTETFTDTNSGGTSNVTQFITGNNYLIVSSNSTTFNVTVNTTAFDANFVGQSEYANLDTDSTNDLTTTSVFNNASGDVNVSGHYNDLVLDVNCVAVTGSADLCDGGDAVGSTYTNGTGISLVGTQFNHSDTSTQASSDNNGRTYIQDITLDGMGHITAVATATETVVDTNSGGISNVTQLITGSNYLIVNSNATTFNITVNTTTFDAAYVGQSEYANLDTDATNDLTTTTAFANASGDINVTGTYNALVLEANCVAITGSADLCDGSDAGGSAYTNGTGISLVGTQFNHSDTSSVSNSDNSGNTFIQDITFDTMGHVETVVTATASFTDTNSGGTSNVTQLITGNNYLIVTSNSTTFNITANFTSLNASFNDSAAIAAKASPGTCAAGTVVQNTTTGGVQCLTLPTVYTYSANETNGYIAYWSGTPTVLQFNETKLNLTITSRALSTLGNATAVNTSANIQLLGFNTTTQLNTYFIRNSSIPTCGGTDKLTSAGNGVFTCATDQTGGGGFTNGSDISVGFLNASSINVSNNISLGGYLNLQAGGGIVGAGGNMNGTTGCAAGQVLSNVSISSAGVWSGVCVSAGGSDGTGGWTNTSTNTTTSLDVVVQKINGYPVSGPVRSVNFFYTDFMAAGAFQTDFGAAAISSGTSNDVVAAAGNENHPGTVDIRDSTTANGGYRYYSAMNMIVLNNGTSGFVTFLPGVASTVNWTVIMGFHDATTSALPTDGCFFISINNNTNYQARCRSNSAETNSTTNVTLPVSTNYYRAQVNVINTSLVQFQMFNSTTTNFNKIWEENITSNIPSTAARATGFGIIGTQSTTGAAQVLLTLDEAGWYYNTTVVRR